jgi:hypothetical protein
MLDDYVVEKSMRERGVIGSLHISTVREILSVMANDERVSEEDFEAIAAALKPLVPR